MKEPNHVSKDLSTEELKTIEEYLRTCREYRDVCGGTGKKYAMKQRILQLLNGLIVATGIGSTFAVGPLGLVIISGLGVVFAFGEKMSWGDKSKNCKFLAEEFSKKEKKLVACRRGTETFEHSKFTSDLLLLEEMLSTKCPAMTKTFARWEKNHPKTN